MHVCVCVCITHIAWSPWRSEEGVRSLGTGVTGSGEIPGVTAGNRVRATSALTHGPSPQPSCVLHEDL